MDAPPLALEEVEQHAFAGEGVTEGIAVGPTFLGALDDELRVDRRSQGHNKIRVFRTGHAAKEIEVEVLADDRGMAQHVLRLRRQPREAFQDCVT